MVPRRRFALPGLLLTALALTGLLVGAGHAAPAHARTTAPVALSATRVVTRASAVPQGFVGVDIDGPVTAVGTNINLADQLATMAKSGVQSIRVAFNWAAAEPYATMAQVPATQLSQFTDVGGVPVDWAPTDAIVAAAARRHIAVLPTILYAPPWDGVNNPAGVEYPARPAPYAAFAAALVHRYGPGGSFWSANPQLPRRPITEWQIWNEPDLAYYWRQPFDSGYTALLRAAHASIKAADPHATVVLGALTNRAWISIGQLERQRGFSHLFDAVSVNAFTKLPANVILYLRYVRRALDRDGNRTTPILATELSWPAAVGHVHDGYDFDVTPSVQARDLATLLPLLGAQRNSLRLAGFDYYTWMSTASGTDPFDYSGLLTDAGGTVRAAPALAAFRHGALALEGCLSTGSLATDCRR